MWSFFLVSAWKGLCPAAPLLPGPGVHSEHRAHVAVILLCSVTMVFRDLNLALNAQVKDTSGMKREREDLGDFSSNLFLTSPPSPAP